MYNLRFPGQYWDNSIKLSHNWYRTYNPETGRYVQSDPIGLGGGLNTFGYAGGNPTRWIDPYGLDYGFSVDPAAAAGNGHTTLYFQDKQGGWYEYNQGAAGDVASGGNAGFAAGLDAPAGVSITPVTAPPPNALIYPSPKESDGNIANCAIVSQAQHNSGKKKYNLYSNNCTDSVVDVMKCAGINLPNPSFTVKPNSWVKQLPPPPEKASKPSSGGISK